MEDISLLKKNMHNIYKWNFYEHEVRGLDEMASLKPIFRTELDIFPLTTLTFSTHVSKVTVNCSLNPKAVNRQLYALNVWTNTKCVFQC